MLESDHELDAIPVVTVGDRRKRRRHRSRESGFCRLLRSRAPDAKLLAFRLFFTSIAQHLYIGARIRAVFWSELTVRLGFSCPRGADGDHAQRPHAIETRWGCESLVWHFFCRSPPEPLRRRPCRM